jgi:hypothetical protein
MTGCAGCYARYGDGCRCQPCKHGSVGALCGECVQCRNCGTYTDDMQGETLCAVCFVEPSECAGCYAELAYGFLNERDECPECALESSRDRKAAMAR